VNKEELESALWAAADKEQAALLAANPERAGDQSLPVPQLIARGAMEDCGERFAAGDRMALMQAIWWAARHKMPMPDWAAKAYMPAFESVKNACVGSWDDAFGRPYPKGTQIAVERKRKLLRFWVFNIAFDIIHNNPETPIDERLWEKVAQRLLNIRGLWESIGRPPGIISVAEVARLYYGALKEGFPSLAERKARARRK